MSDPKDTFHFEIHIDRTSMRRGLVVGGTLLLMSGAGVALAVPTTFKDGDTLTAAALNQNFTNLESRVATLEMSNTRQTQSGKYSTGAVYCGETVNTPGDLSSLSAVGAGYAKAKAVCEVVAGCSPTAHVCTLDEIFAVSRQEPTQRADGSWARKVRAPAL